MLQKLILSNERIKREEYSGVLVKSMMKAMKSREINYHLKLDDKNEIDRINNVFKTNGKINGTDMNILYRYYYNFVMWGFRYQL